MTFGLIAAMTAGLVTGCGSNEEQKTTEPAKDNATSGDTTKNEELSGKITAAGSTALLPLVKVAAKEFQNKHKNVTIDVTGGGSGTGLKSVAEGSVDIGNSDNEAPKEDLYKDLKDHIVAVAPFVLITHKEVGVEGLTKDQAIKVLSGEVKNWKDVGGKDQKITIVGRPDGSGSRKYIRKAILGEKDFPKDQVTQDTSGALRQAVEQTAGAIGYVDAAYVTDKVKALKYDGVEYKAENVHNGTYKLFTNEHMYTKGEPNKLTKAFLDYMMSDEFQKNFVEKNEFIPVKK